MKPLPASSSCKQDQSQVRQGGNGAPRGAEGAVRGSARRKGGAGAPRGSAQPLPAEGLGSAPWAQRQDKRGQPQIVPERLRLEQLL